MLTANTFYSPRVELINLLNHLENVRILECSKNVNKNRNAIYFKILSNPLLTRKTFYVAMLPKNCFNILQHFQHELAGYGLGTNGHQGFLSFS